MEDINKNDSVVITSPVPKLEHRAEFEQALEHYKINPDAISVLQRTPFVLMVSVTAAGRNTIIDQLLKTDQYHFIVSDTTRPIRIKDGAPIEQDGVQYFFRDEVDVLKDVKAGQFIGVAIIHNQQVSGVSIREVERALNSGKIAITDIEVQGCEYIMKAKPDTIPIFVLPPNFKEWLDRINKRSNLGKQEIKNRLETAVNELTVALNDDRFAFVVNDKLEDAVKAVDDISHGGSRYNHHNDSARQIATQLRSDAEVYLASN